MLAIREAFLIFIDSPFVIDRELIVESDSINAVNWVNSPSSTPWRVLNFINHNENLKKQLKGWKVTHVFREVNCITDQLAKERVGRCNDLLVRSWG
ncbi:hypothetical protein PTKIN_Ptkin11bG0166300 [Pterospermum kingtungense]